MIDLNLYPKFRADIDSPVVSIHYIMIIGWDRLDLNETSVGSPVENSIYLSQKKERFDGVYYQDYDLKIPSINEIHDFRDNKYKINNISVTLSNYQTHQTRFSDLLQDRTFLNNTVMIFYKSNSCETLADCLPIYCGVIKNLKHDDKKVSVSVEDFTEKYLDTKVPVHYMGKDASGSVPDKYLTSPIPMTFGAVDFAKVPFSTNIFNGDETVKIRLYVDSQEIDDLEDDVFNVGSVQLEHTPIYIFDNHFYNIRRSPDEIKNPMYDNPDLKPDDPTETQVGFIAQEVEEALKKHNISNVETYAPTQESGIKTLTYGNLIFPLIKAVQELSSKVTELESKLK